MHNALYKRIVKKINYLGLYLINFDNKLHILLCKENPKMYTVVDASV